MNRLKKYQVIKELERLQSQNQSGLLVAERVVEVARDENSVLHSQFEWDDTKAGHRYRLAQARQLIRTIVIHEERTAEPIRSFVSLPSDRAHTGGGYRHMSVVLSIDSLKQEKLRELQQAIDRMLERYDALLNLEPQFVEIRNAVPRFTPDRSMPAPGNFAQQRAAL